MTKPLPEFARDEYFKIDVETHIVPPTDSLKYLFEYNKTGKGYGITRVLGLDHPDLPPTPHFAERDSSIETVVRCMDRYGIDVACAMREDLRQLVGGVAPACTNDYVIQANRQYPDRFIPTFDLSPIINRDMKHVLWELDYLVTNENCKAVGEFCPFGEGVRADDRRFWPLYAKMTEMGLVLIIHTGMNWVGNNSYTCHPQVLEDIALEFPSLKIIALHCGWPYHHDLNLIASSYENIYISISLLCPWFLTSPMRMAHILGEALQFVGPDKVVWGSDNFGSESRIRMSVQGFSQFEMPENLQEEYGYPPLTEEDRRKIFGLNLANLFGIDPKRRVEN